MWKNWFTIFNVKVTVRVYIIKIWLFLLFLLKYWSICNQTWFDSIALWGGVSCGKIGLLCWRLSKCSNYQWIFVWVISSEPQNILYQTWHGDAASWARVPYRNNYLLSSRSRSQLGLISSEYDSFYYIFWTVDFSAAKLSLMIHHHKPEEEGLLRSRSRSQQRVNMSVFVQSNL